MRNRKSKALRILLSVSAVLSFAGISSGANGVKYTKHNLGATQAGIVGEGHTQWFSTEETEICVFCHIPHNPNTAGGKKFLWNRSEPSTTGAMGSYFALYTASTTLNFNKSGAVLSEVSKMCMSCHDGVTALNSMANPRAPLGGTYPPNMQGYSPDTYAFFGDIFPPIPVNIGEGDTTVPLPGNNLTNDHPVSFTYAQSATPNDPTIKAADGGGNSVGGLPLWEGKVECVTCHDPHINYNASYGGNATLKPFLRKSNSSSSLCFTCHDK